MVSVISTTGDRQTNVWVNEGGNDNAHTPTNAVWARNKKVITVTLTLNIVYATKAFSEVQLSQRYTVVMSLNPYPKSEKGLLQ